MSEEFKIEKGIPIPSDIVGKYPFGTMEVGDSFTCLPYVNCPKVCKAQMAAGYYKRKHPGWNYVCRREGDHFRIWRTE